MISKIKTDYYNELLSFILTHKEISQQSVKYT